MNETNINKYKILADILLEKVKKWELSLEEARKELKKINNNVII